MVNNNTTLQKGGGNTSYANLHAPSLWAFYRLILKDPATALACGFDATQRLSTIENVSLRDDRQHRMAAGRIRQDRSA